MVEVERGGVSFFFFENLDLDNNNKKLEKKTLLLPKNTRYTTVSMSAGVKSAIPV